MVSIKLFMGSTLLILKCILTCCNIFKHWSSNVHLLLTNVIFGPYFLGIHLVPMLGEHTWERCGKKDVAQLGVQDKRVVTCCFGCIIWAHASFPNYLQREDKEVIAYESTWMQKNFEMWFQNDFKSQLVVQPWNLQGVCHIDCGCLILSWSSIV